jgi:hypothetical protein
MDVVLKHRGRKVTSSDVAFIKELINQHPDLSRRRLSVKLCEAWNWYQANGHPRDMVCRGLMLALHRRELIQLPPRRVTPNNPFLNRARPERIEVSQIPLCASLKDIDPVELSQVRRSAEEALVNSLIEQHHYLGYVQPVGEHLKYLVTAHGRPIGCFCWSSAPRHLGPRDRFITEARQRRMLAKLAAAAENDEAGSVPDGNAEPTGDDGGSGDGRSSSDATVTNNGCGSERSEGAPAGGGEC